MAARGLCEVTPAEVAQQMKDLHFHCDSSSGIKIFLPTAADVEFLFIHI